MTDSNVTAATVMLFFLKYNLNFLCFIGEQICVWFKGMHSQYGCITTRKSVQAAPRMTPRDKFILQHFVFLEGHIICQQHTTRGPVSIEQICKDVNYFNFITKYFVHEKFCETNIVIVITVFFQDIALFDT